MVAYFMCYTQEKAGHKGVYLGAGYPHIFYIALTIICIMVFGVESLESTFYPTLGQSVEFQSSILDRLESLWLHFVLP